jgi:transposase
MNSSLSATPCSWVGVDVSKAHWDVYCLQSGRTSRYGNDASGIEQLQAGIAELEEPAVVCGASGVYEWEMVLTF